MVLGGSVAGDKIGKQVASPLITLVDFANSFDGKLCPVPVFVDDEGTKAEDAVIIEEGILKNYLHNLSLIHIWPSVFMYAYVYAFFL